MANLAISPEIPLQEMAWKQDYETRFNPVLLTTLLRRTVPVLDYVDFRVVNAARGYAQTLLPLNTHSTDQDGVHQAAILAMAADYAGSLALGSIIPGFPMFGVHPQRTNNGASLWSVAIRVDYKLPSSCDVVVTARVPETEHTRIASRYSKGQMVLETVEVQLEGNEGICATAYVTYLLRQAQSLKPMSVDIPPNVIFTHKRKASARLSAGLRAMECGHATPLFNDPYSQVAASEQGKLLAQAFLRDSPQLKDMIANRTRHVDDLVTNHRPLSQLVLIGAGLDFRPFRLSEHLHGVTVFEVDLPSMLDDRERLIEQFEQLPQVRRIAVECNLELQDVGVQLLDAGFDPTLPAIVIIEGVSMYLKEEINTSVLISLREILKRPESRIWLDVIDHSLLLEARKFPEVASLLDGMSMVGNPFMWAPAGRKYFEDLGFRLELQAPSDLFRPSTDPVFDLYRFLLLAADNKAKSQLRS